MISSKIHEHGHLILESQMGDDLSIVNNARVSFNDENRYHSKDCISVHSKNDVECNCDDQSPMDTLSIKDKGLILFLMNNRHGSPFESVTFRLDIKAPLFVFREWHRHRIGWSYNEWSARYSKIEPEFYVPQRNDVRTQVGKPGAYTFETVADDSVAERIQQVIRLTQKRSYREYEKMVEDGVAKEIARTVLPVGTYSRMKATCNLRSAMHFLSLRNTEYAQREIREYAQMLEAMVTLACPVAMEAFVENGRVCP